MGRRRDWGLGEGAERRLFVVVVLVLVWMLLLLRVGEGLWSLWGTGGLLRLLLLSRRRPWFVNVVGVVGWRYFVVEKTSGSSCVLCRKVDGDGLMLNARPKSSGNHEVILGFCCCCLSFKLKGQRQHHPCEHLPQDIDLNCS